MGLGQGVVMGLGHFRKKHYHFTSLSLGQKLINRQLTLEGTMHCSKREIPKALVQHHGSLLHLSIFAFNLIDDLELVSDKEKSAKTV